MTQQFLQQEIIRIRSSVNFKSPAWIINELSRLLIKLERDTLRTEIILEMYE